jgi:acyl-CoA hydrolase
MATLSNLPGKPVSASAIHDQTAIVFPNDLNSLGTLFGGRVMEQADRVAAVVARRHSGRACVTLGIDSLRFHASARHGDILIFQAAVNRVWRTSMEIGLKVLSEDVATTKRTHIVSAYFTFVGVDDQLNPIEIPPVIPETDEDKRRYAKAQERRERRFQEEGKK